MLRFGCSHFLFSLEEFCRSRFIIGFLSFETIFLSLDNAEEMVNYGHRKKSDTTSVAEVCGLICGFHEIHKLLLLCCFSTSNFSAAFFFLLHGWLCMKYVPMEIGTYVDRWTGRGI